MKSELSGVKFEVSFLTVALMSIVIIIDTSNKVLLCFLCALIHEGGHLLSMFIFSVKPRGIKLRLFDIVIDADSGKSFFADLVITLSGPLLNLLFAFVFYYIDYTMFVMNLLLGVFNLLPLESFDGGHALYLLLCRKFSVFTSLLIIRVLTFVLLVPMFILGVLVLFSSKYNYSLLLIALYLLAILFLK
ncbi:MAG: hypothetical protein IJE16_02350 [Ruminococcus sp.]|nr:hypothetical protein [Ruminococcus sp.]